MNLPPNLLLNSDIAILILTLLPSLVLNSYPIYFRILTSSGIPYHFCLAFAFFVASLAFVGLPTLSNLSEATSAERTTYALPTLIAGSTIRNQFKHALTCYAKSVSNFCCW